MGQVEALVELEMSAAICGVRTVYVSVWEEIFVHACKGKSDSLRRLGCGAFHCVYDLGQRH